MAKDGAILIDENGTIYQQGVCRGTVVNSVGAGDSMVAGFIAGVLKERDYSKALKTCDSLWWRNSIPFWFSNISANHGGYENIGVDYGNKT